MNHEINLSKHEVKQVMLATLGLLTPPRRKAGKADVLATIRQIHNLQIDTISVVARAHQHILWSRLNNYQTN